MKRLSMPRSFYQKRWRSRLVFFLLLLAVWEVTAVCSGVSPLLLPRVEAVAAALLAGLLHGTLLVQALFSLGMIVLGLAIGALLALGFAVAAQLSPLGDRFIDALTVMAHPLPGMALLPLIVIWFGTGAPAVLVVIVHACLWSLLLSLQNGMRDAPSLYTDIGRNLSMGRMAIIMQILLPAAFSQALAGLRVGWARAWRALISAEMVFGAIGANGGLGWYLFKQRAMMNTPGLFAGIILVAGIGMAVESLLFERLEKKTLRKWQAAELGGDAQWN
ncbi:MAG: ABC transporter permease subunit [Candidatus Limiplasma sp.]|nr:ABC transporter permease subunit [Candidatus Limiplasma sp.]